MPDCSTANIAGIIGRLGRPGATNPIGFGDLRTLTACASDPGDGGKMAAAVMASRGTELTERAQDFTNAYGQGGIPNFRAELAETGPIATPTPIDTGPGSEWARQLAAAAENAPPPGKNPPGTVPSVTRTTPAEADVMANQISSDVARGQFNDRIRNPFSGAPLPIGVPGAAEAEAAAAAQALNRPDPNAYVPGVGGDPALGIISGTQEAPGMSGYSAAAQSWSPEMMAQQRDLQLQYMGAAPWLRESGLGPSTLARYNPGDPANAGMYMDLYGKSQGMPGYWAAQNQDLFNTLPGLYALNNPNADPLQPAQIASMASELGPGGALGTPGQYLDTNAEWDKIFSNQMQTVGGDTAADLAMQDPSLQIEAVKGGMATLAPYMTPQARQSLEAKLNRASLDYIELTETNPQGVGDFLTYLRGIGADDWI